VLDDQAQPGHDGALAAAHRHRLAVLQQQVPHSDVTGQVVGVALPSVGAAASSPAPSPLATSQSPPTAPIIATATSTPARPARRLPRPQATTMLPLQATMRSQTPRTVRHHAVATDRGAQSDLHTPRARPPGHHPGNLAVA
jgi:hypothetical protein